MWHQPPRHVLGALLLAAGRPAEAEAEYRRDLERFRRNGWSLFGLWQSLVAQQRFDDARVVRAQFDQAWTRADVSLRASRIMTSDRPVHSSNEQRSGKEMPVEKFVSLSTGVRMEYVEQGSADGVPVIFLHGVTDSWRSFERVLPLLPPSVHAFAVSARGHGDSSRPDDGYSYSAMAQDLRAFMDAVGLEQAVVVGHSMGASVAQRFVVDHPNRVSGLVLMAAFASLFRDPALTEFYRSSIAPLKDPIDAVFARDWQQSTLARSAAPDHLDVVVAETLKVPARVWHAAFEGFLSTPDFTSELTSVVVPTLIVWGDQDTYTLRDSQERLRAAIPGARLVVYEGAGHGFHWEDPARFSADLAAFLSWSPRVDSVPRGWLLTSQGRTRRASGIEEHDGPEP